MRRLAIFWLGPVAVFWTWYHLSRLDAGLVVFTREGHDKIFGLYGLMFGVEPELIGPMIAKGLVVDGLILCLIIAVRRRRAIADTARNFARAAIRTYRERRDQSAAFSKDSLSSAP